MFCMRKKKGSNFVENTVQNVSSRCPTTVRSNLTSFGESKFILDLAQRDSERAEFMICVGCLLAEA